MRNIPNFSEFYQRALIVIGETDRLSIQGKSTISPSFEQCTHWLIVLEGSEMDKQTGRYQWNVVVFPSKHCGGFDYKYPFYVSESFQSIYEAIDYTTQLEQMAKEDQLFSVAN